MTCGAVILAGGASRRMGSPKALLTLHGETFLDRLIRVFSEHCSPVVAVLGHDADRIRAGVRRPVQFVFNSDHALGQLTSLQCGLRALPDDVASAFFTPVDYPAIGSETIAQIIGEFERSSPDRLLAVPRHAGRNGHPVCLSRTLFGELLALPASAQARDVVHRHRERTLYVDTADRGILEDIDDPAAYERLIASS